jgi:spoIIIJ-associated protein
MEWVETTGTTVAAALDAALDELGVDEDEVEYHVIEEPRSGLFGRIGAHPARIRARIRPISREKPGDRDRRRSGGGRSGRGSKKEGGARRGGGQSKDGGARTGAGTRPDGGERPGRGAGTPAAPAGTDETETAPAAGNPPTSTAGGAGNRRRRSRGGRTPRPQQEERTMSETETTEIPIGEQADAADEFMRGLVGAFALPGDVSVRIEEDTVFVDVDGPDLGILVGPKGATLRAIEDLLRTVVQRRTDGQGARIHLDVAGYQAKRRAALARFAEDLAGRVVASGEELSLEPMSAADRKVVHDTVAAIAGVSTTSEGEEPRRRVVLRPE